MIAVTCRNGEHFSLDPDAIERVETDDGVVVVLTDGTHFVIDQSFDDLLRSIRDHRAATWVARQRLVDGYAASPIAARHARRARSEHPIAVLPDPVED